MTKNKASKKRAKKKAAEPPLISGPAFIWKGDGPKVIYGITFEPGQAVAVEDEAIAARLAINTEFDAA